MNIDSISIHNIYQLEQAVQRAKKVKVPLEEAIWMLLLLADNIEKQEAIKTCWLNLMQINQEKEEQIQAFKRVFDV